MSKKPVQPAVGAAKGSASRQPSAAPGSGFDTVPLTVYEKRLVRTEQPLVAPMFFDRAARAQAKQARASVGEVGDAARAGVRVAVAPVFKVEIAGHAANKLAGVAAQDRPVQRYQVLAPAMGPRHIASDDLDAAVQSVAR